MSKLHRQIFASLAKRVLPDGWQPVDVHPRDTPGWQPGDPLPVGCNSTKIGHKQPGDPPGHNNKSSSTWHERRISHNNKQPGDPPGHNHKIGHNNKQPGVATRVAVAARAARAVAVGARAAGHNNKIGHNNKQPGDPPDHNNKSSSTWHERRTDGGDGAGGGSKGGRRVGKMRRRDRPGLVGVIIEGASSSISTLTGMVRQ